jgi:hypothetical protein
MFIDVFVIRWNSLTGKYPRRHKSPASSPQKGVAG